MKFHALHGVYEEERKIHRLFTVDLKLDLELPDSAYKEDLNSTVNYAEVHQVVKGVMNVSQELIETLSENINTAILNRFPQVSTSEVRLCKTNPPIIADMHQVCFVLKTERS